MLQPTLGALPPFLCSHLDHRDERTNPQTHFIFQIQDTATLKVPKFQIKCKCVTQKDMLSSVLSAYGKDGISNGTVVSADTHGLCNYPMGC